MKRQELNFEEVLRAFSDAKIMNPEVTLKQVAEATSKLGLLADFSNDNDNKLKPGWAIITDHYFVKGDCTIVISDEGSSTTIIRAAD